MRAYLAVGLGLVLGVAAASAGDDTATTSTTQPTTSLATFPATQPSAEMLKEYDTDGDGQLSAQERQAMMQDLLKEVRGQVNQLMLRRYDADSSGALDADERGKMEQEYDVLREQFQKRQQDWMASWDKNGDRKWSQEEIEQLRAASAKLQAEHMGRWDMDGDGALSDDERKLAHWTYALEREKRRLQMDGDGDGQVTAQEEQTYWQKIRTKYDLDKDGRLSDEEGERMRKAETLGLDEWILGAMWGTPEAGERSPGTATRSAGDTRPAPSGAPTTRPAKPPG